MICKVTLRMLLCTNELHTSNDTKTTKTDKNKMKFKIQIDFLAITFSRMKNA